MIGAIIGDIAGSRFEWKPYKGKDFDIFGNDGITENSCRYTDDSVMTVAVADALMEFESIESDEDFKSVLIEKMHHHGNMRPEAGFGRRFAGWLLKRETEPYNSYGNGSAMRVSPVGWYARTLSDAEYIAKLSAEVTHNHPEGIKGAQATAAALWLAKNGKSIEEIKKYVAETYYPTIGDIVLDEIRPGYAFDVSCQGSVPVALVAFFESVSFEDTIKNAVSLGGDSDTIACIAGGIAEAYYGVPFEYKQTALGFLDAEMRTVTKQFCRTYVD